MPDVESHRDRSAAEPLRFDRRLSTRWPIEGDATALRLDGAGFGRTCAIRLVNFSDGGFLGRADEPLDPGALVSVGFSHRDLLARRGVVRRCTPNGDGYHVAVRFELGLAA